MVLPAAIASHLPRRLRIGEHRGVGIAGVSVSPGRALNRGDLRV
jgi:hypothetical protein